MAAKKAKTPKSMPPCRIFFGGQLYHECVYNGTGKAEITYHDGSMKESFENKLTENLTESVKTIIAENPNTGLLTL